MNAKKTPQRMCIACRQMKDKREMLRIVKSAEGIISLDYTGKKNGRGAYVCDSLDCMKKCVKNKLINKTFSCEVLPEIYESILKEYESGTGQS